MAEPNYKPQKIFMERGCQDFALTRRILDNTPHIPSQIIDRPQQLMEDIKADRNSIRKGKNYLLLSIKKGQFVKPCPCTPRYIGCNYFIINLELNCPVDCSYCILQHYLSNPLITVHVNLQDMWSELDAFFAKNRERIFRMGTGELGDSLALDHITENSKDLISYFRRKKAWFELKTKTTNIKNVLKQEPAENVVISWSLSSSAVARELEEKAPPVEERIEAARQVMNRGFPVGFHFDPLIRYPGWKEDYAEVVDKMLKAVDPDRISWISLGSLRFPPDLKSFIRRRFPAAKVFCDEFIRGKDGKCRYFKPLRVELYLHIVRCIRNKSGSRIPVYFCMESEDIWREVLGWAPQGKREVERFLSYPGLS
ncbi:MAG: radical SAM protein [Candidatus Aminicenantes bacterium]